MNPDIQPATKIAPGATLFTLDGARIGNAIIIERVGETRSGTGKDVKLVPIWLIETDFGNRCKFSENEIHDLFGLGYQSDYTEWSRDRDDLRNRTLEDIENAV
jgi:hypothetical protein